MRSQRAPTSCSSAATSCSEDRRPDAWWVSASSSPPAGSNPLARALRADKMTLAALEATLALYEDEEIARREVPVLRMLTELPESIEARAQRLLKVTPAHFQAGAVSRGIGGWWRRVSRGQSCPPRWWSLMPGEIGAHGLALRLRLGDPAVVSRVQDERVLLDVRTVGRVGDRRPRRGADPRRDLTIAPAGRFLHR